MRRLFIEVGYIGVFASDLVQTGLAGGAFEGRAAEDIEGLLPGLFGNGGGEPLVSTLSRTTSRPACNTEDRVSEVKRLCGV